MPEGRLLPFAFVMTLLAGLAVIAFVSVILTMAGDAFPRRIGVMLIFMAISTLGVPMGKAKWEFCFPMVEMGLLPVALPVAICALLSQTTFVLVILAMA